MSHFYANPFSVLLADNVEEMEFQPEFYEAVRNLESFRRSVALEEARDAILTLEKTCRDHSGSGRCSYSPFTSQG